MLPYKKVIAALNFTQLDKNVVAYSGVFSRLSDVKELKFVHVSRPDNFPYQYSDSLQGHSESRKFANMVMQDEVDTDFNGNRESKLGYEFLEGDPLEQILRFVVKENADLLVVGRKRDALDTRRLPIKLARKAPCSVMIIPENAPEEISRILVPIDFSDNSKMALKIAIGMASAMGLNRIYGVHVFFLPLGYSKSGKSGIEYAKVMREAAALRFKKLVEELNVDDIEIKMEYMISRRPAKMIRKIIKKRGCDFVVAGARGQGSLGMLGSVTENIMLNH